jgi:hypothetical protein
MAKPNYSIAGSRRRVSYTKFSSNPDNCFALILVIDIADAERILSLILILSVYYRQVSSAHTRFVFIVILWEKLGW